MGEKHWKRKQRELLKRWEGEVVTPPGKKGPDGGNGWLRWELEVGDIPQYILFALDQAEYGAGPLELPVYVRIPKHWTWPEGIIVMRVKYFEDWFGGCPQSAHQKAMLEMAKQLSAPPCYDKAYWEAMEEMAKEESDE